MHLGRGILNAILLLSISTRIQFATLAGIWALLIDCRKIHMFCPVNLDLLEAKIQSKLTLSLYTRRSSSGDLEQITCLLRSRVTDLHDRTSRNGTYGQGKGFPKKAAQHTRHETQMRQYTSL